MFKQTINILLNKKLYHTSTEHFYLVHSKICLLYYTTAYFMFLLFLGLMLTSTLIFKIFNFFNLTIDIREVCVFLAPLFSSFTVIVTYLFTKEVQVNKLRLNKKYFLHFFNIIEKKYFRVKEQAWLLLA